MHFLGFLTSWIDHQNALSGMYVTKTIDKKVNCYWSIYVHWFISWLYYNQTSSWVTCPPCISDVIFTTDFTNWSHIKTVKVAVDPQSVLSAVIVCKFFFSSFQKCIVIICINFQWFVKALFSLLAKDGTVKILKYIFTPCWETAWKLKFRGLFWTFYI